MRLTTRLFCLLTVAVAPALLGTLYDAWVLRAPGATAGQPCVLSQATVIAAALRQHTRVLAEGLRALDDRKLGRWPDQTSVTACTHRARLAHAHWPQALELGVRTAQGERVCAVGKGTQGRGTMSRAASARAGAQRVDRPDTPAHLEITRVLDTASHGQAGLVAYAIVDLAQWGEDLPAMLPTPQSRVVLADDDGRIILAFPPLPQPEPRLPPSWRKALEHAAHTVSDVADDLGGGRLTLGWAPALSSAHPLWVAVGVAETPQVGTVDWARSRTLTLTALALLLSLLGTWRLGHRAIAQPVQRILTTLNAWQQGAVAARARLKGHSELTRIGGHLDALLDQLGERDAQYARQQHALQTARDEAVAASAAKTRFIASASHDLRQPLHALALTVAALAHQPPECDRPRLMSRLQRGVGTLTELVEALLDLARLDAGQIQPEFSTVPIGPLMEAVIEEFRPLFEAKGLSVTLPACTLCVRSDAALLRTMLRNLVGNAIKFTPAGGRISLRADSTPHSVMLAVQDTGIGIPPERQAEIFEEFRQLGTPERLPGQGLGLGLHIVKRLGALLDHPIAVESQVGAGATFTLTLPRAQQAEENDSLRREP